MKIMHLLQSNHFSGAENVVCQIIDMFRTDADVQMVYVSPEGPIAESLKHRNVPFYGLKKLDYNNVRAAIQKIKPDVIHAHDVTASVMASVAAPRNVKIISHMHVNNANMAKVNLKTLIYCIAAKRFEHIFWVSKSSYDGYVFKNHMKDKSSVLFNVINKDDILKKSVRAKLQDPYDIVFIGRMQYQKNPQKLLNVFKILKEKFNADFKAILIGQGQLYDEICEQKKQMQLDNNVEMAGFVENPMGILKNAKVMVLTSRFEGTPMCALEAMALGVPIVSTPTDGMVDLIDSGENGYLYETDVELAEALYKIISDAAQQAVFSQNAVEKFDQMMNLKEYKTQLERAYNIRG